MLDNRSALAADLLPPVPTPIDVRISQAVCTGEFHVDAGALHGAPTGPINAMPAATIASIAVPPGPPPASPMEVAVKAANGPDGKWYCVSQGTEPGIYSSWYVKPTCIMSPD